jgi:hypothetical protein
MSLQFGVNPFDRCQNERKRFHVVDPDGVIVAKFALGIRAYDYAGTLSDETTDKTFSVIDTRDGSVYGACRNGEDLEVS